MQQTSPAKSQPADATENLWVRAIKNYWSDPANVIGPPGALVRRCIKALWIVLAFYVLFWIAGPSQVASWQLWMQDDELARHIAWGFTFAAALCFAVVGYVAEATQPLRVPVPFPSRLWPLNQWRWVHAHIPNIRVTLGSVLAAALFLIALLGQWNYYLHDNLSTGGASVAALEGSDSRVAEASRALSEHDTATAASLAIIDQAIRETSAGSPTGRSRLVAQRATLTREAATIRTELAAELREARSATVSTRSTATDPRPVDGHVATATGLERGLVSSLLDLLRSGVVEALLVMGAGLGLAGGVSQLGVPKNEKVSRETSPEAETVAPTTATPEEAPAAPPARRRFTLPVATPDDFARAAAIGPLAWLPEPEAPEAPEPETPASDDPEPIVEPSNEEPEIIDPLVADLLNQPPAEERQPELA